MISTTVFAILLAQGPSADLGGKSEIIVPATRVGNYFFVEAKINGQSLQLIVDSGAGLNVLTRAAADKLKVTGGIDVQANGIGKDTTPAKIVTIPEFSLSGATLRNEQFVVIDMPEVLRCDGLVGYSFLKHFATTFDYDKNEMRVADAKTFKPKAGTVASELKIHSNHPNVKAKIDGIEGWVVLDTGNNSSGTILKWLADKQGLGTKWKALPSTIVGRGVGGWVMGQPAITPEFDLAGVKAPSGNFTIDNSGAGAFADKDILANIGAEYLRRFTFTLDYPNKKAYFEPSAAYTNPFKVNRSGIRLDSVKGKFVVLSVIKDSAGDEAGVKTGDQVLSVGGNPVHETHPLLVSEPFNGPEGTRVELVLERDGKKMSVTVVLKDMLK